MTRENRYKTYLIAAIIAVSLVQGLWLFKGMAFDNVDSGLINYISQTSYEWVSFQDLIYQEEYAKVSCGYEKAEVYT